MYHILIKGGENLAKNHSLEYENNVAILKDYGGKGSKLLFFRSLRRPGWGKQIQVEKGSVNDEKLSCNLRRAKETVFQLAICNDWDYFCTFTIDKQKYDRYDLHSYHTAFSVFIRNYNKKHGTNIKYLLVPEQHKDGAWHEHGFFMGLPESHLKDFKNFKSKKLPKYIRRKIEAGEPIFSWDAYSEKFGFCDLEPIVSLEKISFYITKYISKSLEQSCIEINAKVYYCSLGLSRACVKKRGPLNSEFSDPFSWRNDFVSGIWYDGSFNISELEEKIFK